jgi:hypothetical protein
LSNLAFQAVANQGERQCGQIGINEGGSSHGYGTFLALLRRGRRRHVAGGVRLARKDVALSLVTDAILDREEDQADQAILVDGKRGSCFIK